jgi:hypothetical protein
VHKLNNVGSKEMVKHVSKPVQKIVRFGSSIDYHYEVVECGSDENGRFAIVNVGEKSSSVVYCINVNDDDTLSVSQFKPLVPLTADPFVAEEKTNHRDVVEVEQKKATKKSVAPKVTGPIEVTEKLNVILTEDERAAAAKNVSVLLGELDDTKSQLKSLTTFWKNEIKLIEERISRAKQAHNTGLEYRAVKCFQHFDPVNSVTWFTYEGKEYGRREMNEREHRELRSPSLFKDAPILPNRVEPEQDDKSIEKKMKGEIENFKREKKNKKPIMQNETPYSTKEDEIREVMNEEKKKGKHDHSI